jgi:hypothetical protein
MMEGNSRRIRAVVGSRNSAHTSATFPSRKIVRIDMLGKRKETKLPPSAKKLLTRGKIRLPRQAYFKKGNRKTKVIKKVQMRLYDSTMIWKNIPVTGSKAIIETALDSKKFAKRLN